jgi:hypothetical protein
MKSVETIDTKPAKPCENAQLNSKVNPVEILETGHVTSDHAKI